MNAFTPVTLITLLALGSIPGCGDNEGAELHRVPAQSRIEGRYIVVLDDDASPASSFMNLSSNSRSFHHVFNGFATSLTADRLEKIRHEPGVKAVYEVGRVNLSAVQNNPTWGIDRLDQSSANLDSKYQYNVAGAGVTAYVIDTGINVEHKDFNGRARIGTDVTVDAGTRYENVDGHGHGTHVAGTVGSTTYGVAKEVQLVAVKVFDHRGGEASDETVIAGIDFAIADHTANPSPAVINMSLGGGTSEILDKAVRKAVSAGITTVVAAGNDNKDACNYSPAREPQAITVASLARNDRKSSFSNWGKCIDVIAPGSRITSTWKTGGTSTLDGTSMASPHVAGLAALVLSAYPSKTPAEVEQFMIDNSLQGAASGFNSQTPNRIAVQLWNVPEPTPGQPWSNTFTGDLSREDVAVFPSAQGFRAVPGNRIVATMKGSWFGGGNNDLYLKRIEADGTTTSVAESTQSGMNESIDFTVVADGYYVLEVKAVSGGKFTLTASMQAP